MTLAPCSRSLAHSRRSEQIIFLFSFFFRNAAQTENMAHSHSIFLLSQLIKNNLRDSNYVNSCVCVCVQ